jgi:predicted RNA binding protein with dsRBD fold (UPF0201 family)
MCEYCEEGRKVKKKVENFLKANKLANRDTYNTIDLIKIYNEKIYSLHEIIKNSDNIEMKDSAKKEFNDLKPFIYDLQDMEAIEFHKNIARVQRTAYNQNRTIENLNGKILIDIDFKQKFVIGMSPRQVSSEYYNQIIRSCLGN